MKLKIVFLFLLISSYSFSQEWLFYNYTFEFSNIQNKEDFNNFNFKYIDGARTHVESIIYYLDENQFSVSFETMGGGPILFVEKDNEIMYVLLEGSASNSKYRERGSAIKVIFSNFKKGYYKLNKDELIEWSDAEKYIEWINQSDIKNLRVEYRK